MKRIALFGTSADPPTAGHQSILCWLAKRYDWVAVWAADNPFKSHQTPLQHRAAMLRLLIEDIPSSQNIGFYPESSYRTVETVEKAKERWGADANLTLVVGSDLVSQLPRWYQIEDLLQQVQLLIVQRPGYLVEDADLKQLLSLGANCAIADMTGPDVSSTAYRKHGDTQALTPLIQEYIYREHLYKCEDTKEKLQIL